MKCKIVRFQKLIWRNMMRLTKNQKASLLHYSIDEEDPTPNYLTLIKFTHQ